MNYLLYGDDDFTRDEAVTPIKQGIEPADLRDVNISVLSGSEASFDDFAHTCDSVPFLAGKRLVVVEGLLALFERRAPTRARQAASADGAPSLGKWEALAEYLSRAPETTDILFLEGRLTASNPLFAAIRKHVTVRTFPMPNHGELRAWIVNRAAAQGIDIEPGAVDALAATIGPNLRVMASELHKLSLYRWGQTIRRGDVEQMVSYTKEANIFRAVDAMLEGRSEVAIVLMHGLLQAGRPAVYLLTMVARQVRLLILAKELKARKVPVAEQGQKLGLSGFPLRKTLDQEPRFTAARLAEIHRMLLEADLSIKTSAIGDELVLDMLIAEVASTQRRRDLSPSTRYRR